VNLYTFLYRRSRQHWLLLLTLIFGVLLATAFLASGPVLVDALMEFGLRRTLLNANTQADVLYFTIRESADPAVYQRINDRLEAFLSESLGAMVDGLTPAGNVGFLYPWEDGKIDLERRLTVGFYGADLTELDPRVEFASGAFPGTAEVGSGEIPVYIGLFLADSAGVRAGDLLPVSVNPRAEQPELNLRVAGVISPRDYQDPYWLDHFNPFWPLREVGDVELLGVFVPKSAFFSLAEDLYPNLDVRYTWQVNVRLDRFTFDQIEEMQRTFSDLGQDALVVDPGLRLNTTLLELLDGYGSQADIVRAPLYFLLGIVVLMVLYYLVMMASLYLEQLRSEFAILRSRGASSGLLFKLELVEGLVFSALAVLSGPALAWLIVRWSALGGPLGVLAEPGWGLTIPQSAWLAAGVAAAASLGGVLLPLPRALQRSIAAHQQNLARPGRPPWWQRFYLDVFVLGIGIVLLFRVELYGGIIGGSADDPRLDWTLVLAPISLLLGAAAIFLRVFPALLQRGADLASRGRGLPVVLALRQTARDPRHITRLVLLLMLAMALGFFSTSLDATLTKNEADRSVYYVGSDVRVVAEPSVVDPEDLPGVQEASWLWRSEASLITSGFPPGLDLVAVDPDGFAAVSRFREDYSGLPVADLLRAMTVDWEANRIPLPVAAIPGQPGEIGLWFSLPYAMQVDPDRLDNVAGMSFEARLYTLDGQMLSVLLEPVDLVDDPDVRWYFFSGEVPELDPESYPLALVSVWLHSSTLKLGDFEAIWLDDIRATDRSTGEEFKVEDFECQYPYHWHSLTYPMYIYCMQSNPHSGQSGLAMYFERAGISPLRWYGFNGVDDQALQPSPALVSPAFLRQTELQPGEVVRIRVKVPGGQDWDQVTFKIMAVVDYFPTLYENQEAGFLVTLQEPLFSQIDLYRYFPIQSSELLISSAEPDLTRKALLDSGLLPDQALSVETVLREVRTNPLAIGLRSVTQFGYYLTTVLSLVGFGTHFYMSTRQRAANFSILRALGLSPGQLYTALFVEQVVLMLSGLALGTLLGLLLNELTLSGLPLRLGELDTVPPFLVQTDWRLIVRVYATLVAAFLGSLGVAIFFLWRVQIHRVLRIGEE